MTRRGWLLVLFLVLQLCDLLTTLYVFHKGGVELNPVVRALFPALGPILGVLLVKLVACGFVFRLRGSALLSLVTLAYCGVVAWNTVVVFA